MADDQPDGSRKWFGPPLRGRRHVYYRAISNVPGVLLFSLIGTLGTGAVAVAAWHALHRHSLPHDDRVLGLIGLGCVTLALLQIRSLLRRAG